MPSEKESNPRTLWTSTLKAGSELLMMCVKETATFDMLTVAATCPIVWARATYRRDKDESAADELNSTAACTDGLNPFFVDRTCFCK